MPTTWSDWLDLLSRWFPQEVLLRDAVASVIVILLILVAQTLALRAIRRTQWGDDKAQLRWTALSRRAALLVITGSLIIIWATELRNLAVSLVAFAAAVVLATKELIMCVSGTVVRTTSNAYSIGDRIEIGGVRGDVIYIGLLTTRVLEIGPGQRRTGRAVVLPHSLLLNSSVINETFTDDYVVHTVAVPVPEDEAWSSAEARLLGIANEVCAPFLDDARAHMEESAARHGIPTFNIEPTATLQAEDATKLKLLVRVPTRAREKGHTEQLILRGYFRPRNEDGSPAGKEGPAAEDDGAVFLE